MKSKQSGANQVTAANEYAVPVVRYSAGIINWTRREAADLDTRTRKILNMHKALHLRYDVNRLSLSRNEGNRGLKSIKEAITSVITLSVMAFQFY